MRTGISIAAVLWLTAASAVKAEDGPSEVEGRVRNVGTAVSSKVILAGDDGKGPALCRTNLARSISRISGMTVKVKGRWERDKSGELKCLIPESFTVTKTSSGRDAVVGKLEKDGGGGYKLTTDDGKTHAFADIPAGLKKLEGKKVILDVKRLNTPNALHGVEGVVTYSAFPD